MSEEIKHSVYLRYLPRCPKCGKHRVYLLAVMRRSWGGPKYCGPYYWCFHYRRIYDKERYRMLKAKGISRIKAIHKAQKNRHDGACRFGKAPPFSLTPEEELKVARLVSLHDAKAEDLS